MTRALITGWFGFELMGATAGDIQAAELAKEWLAELDIPADLAVAAPFEGDVNLAEADPRRYTHFLFVCGPIAEMEMTRDLLDRFSHCIRIGLNLTMLQSLAAWSPFDILLERDSERATRADMTFHTSPPKVPVVGLVLVKPQPEYRERGRHAEVKEAFLRVLRDRASAILPIDTRLDQNAGGLRSSAEVETLLSRCDLVLTTRLHGTVLSLKNGVPPLVIDPIAGGAKVSQQAKHLHWPCCFVSDSVTHESLLEAFDWCLSNAAASAVNQCRDRAMDMVQLQKLEFLQAVATFGSTPSRQT